MPISFESNDQRAAELAAILSEHAQRIVFAESCTAGLVSASLARIAGVSQVLVGSAVVYDPAAKCDWLGVDPDLIESAGVVSRQVSEQMAIGVLQKTPLATIAASITGHLGPNAPEQLDGTAWSTVASRGADGIKTTSRQLNLKSSDEAQRQTNALEIRRCRQIVAVEQVLIFCLESLTTRSSFNQRPTD